MNSNESMSFNEYQNAAMGFRLETATPIYALLNLAAEAGEVAGLAAKAVRDGHPFDYQQKIKKELGDVLWQVAAVAMDNGFTLQDIADSNIAKLSERKKNNTIQGSGDNR